MPDRPLDPWAERQHPDRYDPSDLRRMLVDDYVWNRALGGPSEKGCAFLIGACARIARLEGKDVDAVFESILAEGASVTGRTTVALA